MNVTSVNALGKASTTISFEESSIGKIDGVSCCGIVLDVCNTLIQEKLVHEGACVFSEEVFKGFDLVSELGSKGTLKEKS